MPSDELMRPIAEPSFSGGSSSRMMLMPSGIAPMAKPCSARPINMGTKADSAPQISDPTTRNDSAISSIRRLPTISPSRPNTGVATAPASSVTVITQAALELDVFNSVGKCASNGTIRV